MPTARFTCAAAVVLVIAVGCGSSGGTSASSSGGDGGEGGSGSDSGSSSGAALDGSGSSSGGGPITCSNPGNYTMNGGKCGTERWSIKTGTDSQSGAVGLSPQPNTIATLAGLPAAGGGSSRESPTETTLWELKDVTLSMIKLESDSDYHMVLSDGSHTLIAEIPYPTCTGGSPWTCYITHARSIVDARYSVSTSPQYPSQTVTVRGVGFFDFIHGQTGVAPNGIELHPVLQICFGQGCTPS